MRVDLLGVDFVGVDLMATLRCLGMAAGSSSAPYCAGDVVSHLQDEEYHTQAVSKLQAADLHYVIYRRLDICLKTAFLHLT